MTCPGACAAAITTTIGAAGCTVARPPNRSVRPARANIASGRGSHICMVNAHPAATAGAMAFVCGRVSKRVLGYTIAFAAASAACAAILARGAVGRTNCGSVFRYRACALGACYGNGVVARQFLRVILRAIRTASTAAAADPVCAAAAEPHLDAFCFAVHGQRAGACNFVLRIGLPAQRVAFGRMGSVVGNRCFSTAADHSVENHKITLYPYTQAGTRM